MEINGVEVEFNPTDWKETEREEKARATFRSNITSVRGLPPKESIKKGCSLVIKYFDDAYGKGTGRKVLGAETDFMKCVAAMTESIVQVAKIQKEIIDAVERLDNVAVTSPTANDGTYRGN